MVFSTSCQFLEFCFQGNDKDTKTVVNVLICHVHGQLVLCEVDIWKGRLAAVQLVEPNIVRIRIAILQRVWKFGHPFLQAKVIFQVCNYKIFLLLLRPPGARNYSAPLCPEEIFLSEQIGFSQRCSGGWEGVRNAFPHRFAL